MSLGTARRTFSGRLGLLYHYMTFLGLQWAKDHGTTCDDCPKHMDGSNHGRGLAEDILIYGPNGEYPHPEWQEIYSTLHDYWDAVGGAERIADDLNHFSDSWGNIR